MSAAQIKVVRNEAPNGEGRWLDLPEDADFNGRITEVFERFSAFIPTGHHAVAVRREVKIHDETCVVNRA